MLGQFCQYFNSRHTHFNLDVSWEFYETNLTKDFSRYDNKRTKKPLRKLGPVAPDCPLVGRVNNSKTFFSWIISARNREAEIRIEASWAISSDQWKNERLLDRTEPIRWIDISLNLPKKYRDTFEYSGTNATGDVPNNFKLCLTNASKVSFRMDGQRSLQRVARAPLRSRIRRS